MNRNEFLDRLSDSSEVWDVIVIGGGATGLGTAVDAATRGYRTVLLEKHDFSEGTSSRSTKLIHGGVRYLRSGEIGLVRESLRERGRLLKNAGDLVKPLSFVVPAYRWYERLFYGTGLALYDALAGDLGIHTTEHLSSKDTLLEIPNLRSEGLYGSTYYWDGQFDDARLSVAMARTAAENGAVVANHVGVSEMVKEKGKVRGVVARDEISGAEYRIFARVVVNATGVFSDEVRRMDEPASMDRISPSQGIHIVLDQKFLGGNTAIMIPNTDDGRVLFAIPWHNRVLLGTTDTGNVPVEINPKPMEEEVEYLIEHAGRYLSMKPSHGDIRASFAGLRPLVSDPTKGGDTSKISRTHSLTVSDSGLVTIAGGKWTTYRQMAEDTVDRVADVGGLEIQPCSTYDLPLLDSPSTMCDSELLDPDLPYTKADAERSVREEMAVTLSDAISRRMRCTFLDEEATKRCAEKVARLMAAELGTDETWVAEQLKLLESECADIPQSVSR